MINGISMLNMTLQVYDEYINHNGNLKNNQIKMDIECHINIQIIRVVISIQIYHHHFEHELYSAFIPKNLNSNASMGED